MKPNEHPSLAIKLQAAYTGDLHCCHVIQVLFRRFCFIIRDQKSCLDGPTVFEELFERRNWKLKSKSNLITFTLATSKCGG